jgi:GNAT superfamily N-acetyltransferase
MIGDVNLFLYDDEDEEDWRFTDDEAKKSISNDDMKGVVGELEIMVARKNFQGKGLGREILLTFLWYFTQSCSGIMSEYHGVHGGSKKGSCIKHLRVKIDAENRRSIRSFEGIGFLKTSETPNYFGELELRLPWSKALVGAIERRLGVIPLDVEYE